jgi:hypothetical protein
MEAYSTAHLIISAYGPDHILHECAVTVNAILRENTVLTGSGSE